MLEVGELDLGAVASESVDGAPASRGEGDHPHARHRPVVLTADRARIAQLLDNLVSNAVKFTPEGGRVDVRVRARESQAIIEVRDSGMGIPGRRAGVPLRALLPHEHGHRAGNPGTGLGLAISKAIVEAHGGQITVASEERAGTTFRIALPLHADAQLAERTEAA